MGDGEGRYRVGAVANYFLEAGDKDGVPITHLKLQKLVSIAYGFHLAFFDQRLFNERVEAWDLGPVVPELYHEFKRFGYEPITSMATVFDHHNGRFYTVRAASPRVRKVLRFVWERYGKRSATQLVQLTHAPGTPWRKARDKGETVIDDGEMRDHYRELARRIQRRRTRRSARLARHLSG